MLTTPTEDTWPGVSRLPDYKATFPNWTTNCLESSVVDKLPADRGLSKHGLDLLEQMLIYDPSGRISAKSALQHPYFDSLDKTKLPAYRFS